MGMNVIIIIWILVIHYIYPASIPSTPTPIPTPTQTTAMPMHPSNSITLHTYDLLETVLFVLFILHHNIKLQIFHLSLSLSLLSSLPSFIPLSLSHIDILVGHLFIFFLVFRFWCDSFCITNSLRTSETNYLNEAFSFYAAIRGRAYYSRTSKDDRSVQM